MQNASSMVRKAMRALQHCRTRGTQLERRVCQHQFQYVARRLGDKRLFCGGAPPVAALSSIADELMVDALNYAMTHGLVYADKEPEGDLSRATQCPFALTPLKVPAKAFHEAKSLGPLWGLLVDAAARDPQWLYATLEVAARADPFTQRLIEICKSVHAEPGGLKQKLYFGVLRSDYMIHEPDGDDARFLQVELNTIASSFGSLSAKTSDLHKYLLGRFTSGACSRTRAVASGLYSHFGAKRDSDLQSYLPENGTLQHIPDALFEAHRLYCKNGDMKEAAVLFVVQGDERNFADQRWLEYELWERHGVAVIRKTLRDVQEESSIDAASGRLWISGVEVSVVYFRAGYVPDDYPSEAEWEGRLILERSLAVKCPSVAYQLVGAKKIQQAIAQPGAAEKFIGTDAGAALRVCFAGLWGLGPGEEDAEIVSKAIVAPHQYVMKPQREGGGHNLYGDTIAEKLKLLSIEERGAFIMMQRILPRTQEAVLTRMGKPLVVPTLSEFGFYSVFIGDGENVHLNKHAGHLIRTKPYGVDEGGVAAGYAMLNSPFLVQ